nr:ribonuclease E/G [Paracoccus fontiphilus]
MAKKMLIDATHAEETRVVVVDGTKVEEFDFETVNKRQISGNIYLAKVTRVEPSLQAAFVDYGGNRHGFLAFAEIHPDYYQIPAADREALIAEERAYAEAQEAEDAARARRRHARAEKAGSADEVIASDEAEATGDEDADTVGAEASGDDADIAGTEQAGDEDGAEPTTDASDKDEDIESVADEDVAEEIRVQKKPRPRRYKIQEVIKVRQIMLVQVVKEERGNKGAALTTYLSLPGRYCVLMPNTARGGGISRKITNAVDRKKLKDIASELDVPKGAGLIIRTAGSQRTRTEIRRDYEYLLRLWEQIRDLTFKSIAPAPIYEEGDLIKRVIRDLYNAEIDEVLVEGERGYRVAKDFMKMIMPTHSRAVQQYTDSMPLFARYQVESYLAGMFNPVVQLKSGGYIVIGVTEALVAIDVNSGRATKEGSIEETALKTNLEAADEVARQLRLRDLAGLIVIDFIDMEERRNNAAVEKRLKDKLKSDRARIQVGRISGFGLMEMSRQRLRPGMLESTTQPCAHCHGTGLIRSDDSLALTILRAIEEEGTRKRSREVLVKAPVAVINYLINQKREHIAGIEARYGLSVRLEADPSLISPDFAIEKFKTATRNVPEVSAPVLSVDADLMAQIDDEDEDLVEDNEVEAEAEAEDSADAVASDEENGEGRSRRRRRRRRRKNGERAEGDAAEAGDEAEETAEDAAEAVEDTDAAEGEGNGRRRRPPKRATRPRRPPRMQPRRSRTPTRPRARGTAAAAGRGRATVAGVAICRAPRACPRSSIFRTRPMNRPRRCPA